MKKKFQQMIKFKYNLNLKTKVNYIIFMNYYYKLIIKIILCSINLILIIHVNHNSLLILIIK